jgi:DNA-binding transcriptional LysR family regulator
VACRGILDRVDEAERAAAGMHASPRGELIVAAPLVFGRLHVLPVVAEYRGDHRDVDVRLLLGDRNADLLEDHIDVAVRIGRLPGQWADGAARWRDDPSRLRESDVSTDRVCRPRPGICATSSA